MSPSTIEFLEHIQAECQYLLSNSNIDFDVFVSDENLKRAFCRSLEIIGEATKKLPDTVTNQYTLIPWSDIAKMRDKLIHHYFGVDYEILWDVIKNEIPDLNIALLEIIQKERT